MKPGSGDIYSFMASTHAMMFAVDLIFLSPIGKGALSASQRGEMALINLSTAFLLYIGVLLYACAYALAMRKLCEWIDSESQKKRMIRINYIKLGSTLIIVMAWIVLSATYS